MIPVTFSISGETKLLAHLDALPEEVRAKLYPTIEELTKELLEGVRSAEPIRTGALRAATRSFMDQGPTFIRGRVRVLATPTGARTGRGVSAHNVAAAALEYGVHASFTVRAHQMRLTHIFRRPFGSAVFVDAYTRRVSITARRFLRDPFAAIRPRAEAAIRAALESLER